MTSPYRRVLLKLSGEAFGGGKLGVDPDIISGIAAEISEVVSTTGVQVAVVTGGGNFFRGDGGLRDRGRDPLLIRPGHQDC